MTTPGDGTEPKPRGPALWEIAVEGGRSRQAGAGPAEKSVGARLRLPLGIAGGVGILALVVVVVSVGAGSGATAPSAGAPSAAAGGGPGQGPGAAPPGAYPTSRSGPACTAQVLNASPAVGSTTEIVISGVTPGPAITVALAYPGGSERYSVPSNGTPGASVPVTVGDTPPGAPVQVSVTAGASSCRTSFTPTAPPSG